MLPQEITVANKAGTNGRGEDIYADPVTLPAYVEHRHKLVRDRTTGDQRASGTTVWFNIPTVVPTTDSLVTLPSGALADIIDVAIFDFDDRTPNHIEIFCA
jgi:hypothetical protein